MLHHEQHSSIPRMNLSQVSNKAQHLVKNQSKCSFGDSFKKSSSSEEEEKVNWSMLGPVLQPGEVRRPSVYVRKKDGNDLLSDNSPSPGARLPGNIVLPHRQGSNASDRIRRSLLSNHL
jgi:hypothetical protein